MYYVNTLDFYSALNEKDFCRETDQAGNNHSEWGNPDPEIQMLHVFSYTEMIPYNFRYVSLNWNSHTCEETSKGLCWEDFKEEAIECRQYKKEKWNNGTGRCKMMRMGR